MYLYKTNQNIAHSCVVESGFMIRRNLSGHVFIFYLGWVSNRIQFGGGINTVIVLMRHECYCILDSTGILFVGVAGIWFWVRHNPYFILGATGTLIYFDPVRNDHFCTRQEPLLLNQGGTLIYIFSYNMFSVLKINRQQILKKWSIK